MIICSRVSVDKFMSQHYQEDQLKDIVKDKLFQEMGDKVVEKLVVTEEFHEPTNSMEYTGELAVLTKEEYRELKTLEVEYYRMLNKNLGGN